MHIIATVHDYTVYTTVNVPMYYMYVHRYTAVYVTVCECMCCVM